MIHNMSLQVKHASCSGFCRGTQLLSLQPRSAARSAGVLLIRAAGKEADLQARIPTERLRLNNLSPQPGARRPNKRKGRGYGAGQVGVQGTTSSQYCRVHLRFDSQLHAWWSSPVADASICEGTCSAMREGSPHRPSCSSGQAEDEQ